MMTRHYKDWTIDIQKIDNHIYGAGFRANTYIEKTNGLKADVRVFTRYGGVKTYKEMLEYAQRLLDI